MFGCRIIRTSLGIGSKLGIVTQDFCGRCAAMREAMNAVVEFFYSTEQLRDNLEEKHSELMENNKRKVAQEVQAVQAATHKTVEAARIKHS
jgi:hypothetical protein